jgi:hypothetical protein
VPCIACNGVTHGFRRSYITSAHVTYHYWALACSSCGQFCAPEELPQNLRNLLYKSSVHRPSNQTALPAEQMESEPPNANAVEACDMSTLLREPSFDKSSEKTCRSMAGVKIATQKNQLSRREAVRAFCLARRIDSLVHFTRAENLAGILADGILPRATLDAQVRRVIHNDEIRIDEYKNAVCLSIGFPNYKMFYKYICADQAATWVVLHVRADVLWELDSAFCWANAACSQIKSVPLDMRKELSSFEKMFAPQCEISGVKRADCQIPDHYPTNPQAEVLVFSGVPLEYLTAAYFRDSPGRSKFRNPKGMPITVELGYPYFCPRSDWQLW